MWYIYFSMVHKRNQGVGNQFEPHQNVTHDLWRSRLESSKPLQDKGFSSFYRIIGLIKGLWGSFSLSNRKGWLWKLAFILDFLGPANYLIRGFQQKWVKFHYKHWNTHEFLWIINLSFLVQKKNCLTSSQKIYKAKFPYIYLFPGVTGLVRSTCVQEKYII